MPIVKTVPIVGALIAGPALADTLNFDELEKNVTTYHTIKGRRVSFQNVDTKVAGGQWHTLRVDFESHHFTVSLDGKKVIEAADNSFAEGGKVGVCTKADSVTLFDDFSYGGK